MSNPLATNDKPADVLESVVIGGDLSKLSPAERVSFYRSVCASLGLNPLTKPFDYITLNGRLTLYARKDATEQLRKKNAISIDKPEISFQEEWIVVMVGAHTPDGRTDFDLGVVNKKDMRGDYGNAMMKAITKAKRRVTLSICGLGMLDETEVETIHDARPVTVNVETGEISPKPDEKAWEKWHDLVRQAQDAGLAVEEPGEDINIDQLRQLYRELQAGIKAQEEAQK